MAIAYVTGNILTDFSGTPVASSAVGAIASTTGNLIVVAVRLGFAGSTVTVTDTAGNTYTQIGTVQADYGGSVYLFYALNITGHAANVVTASYSPNNRYLTVCVAEYSGLHATAPLDATVQGGTTPANTTSTSPSFTTVEADELLVMFAHHNTDTAATTAGAGYTMRQSNNSGGLEDAIVASIQTSVTASMSGSNSAWSNIVATFKIASVPVPPIPGTADAYLKEDASGTYLLEDGSGDYLLETQGGLFIGSTTYIPREGTFKIGKVLSAAWTASCEVWNYGGTIPQAGEEVSFYLSGVKRFGGVVLTVDSAGVAGIPANSVLSLTFTGYQSYADRAIAAILFTVFMGGTIGNTFYELWRLYLQTQFGVTKVGNAGPAVTLGEQLFHYITVTEAFNQLRDQSPGWDWWIDDNKLLVFQDTTPTTPNAPFTLRDGDANTDTMEVSTSNSRFRNKQWVLPAADIAETWTDSHVAIAGQVAFSTQYVITELPGVTVDGVAQTVTPNSGAVYYVPDGIGIFFSVAPGAGTLIEITYANPFPLAYSVQDDASIAAVGLYEAVYQSKNITDADTARAFAQGLLDTYGTNGTFPEKITFTYNSNRQSAWLTPGMVMDVDRTFPLALGNYTVEEVQSEEQGCIWRHSVTLRAGLGEVNESQLLEILRTATRTQIIDTDLTRSADGIIAYSPRVPFPSAISRDNWEKHGEQRSVLDFGAKGDCKILFDASISAGLFTLTSASASFVAGDVGKTVYVKGAGAAGADLLTTIATFVNSATVSLTVAAGTTVSVGEARFGTDNQSAFQAAADAINTVGVRGGRVFVPRGAYLLAGGVVTYHMTTFEGEGYSSVSIFGSGPKDPASNIVCVSATPIFQTATNPCYSSVFKSLGFMGVSSTGSKGIYALNAWDLTVTDCFFDCFGDQAVHVESSAPNYSVTGTFRHNFAQNCLLVRTGRINYVGVFDLACTDANVCDNNLTASIGIVGGAFSGGQIGSGFIVALAIRGANSFVRHNQCAISHSGVYVSPEASYSQFVDVRADLNQGHGWVIASSQVSFLGCRSHANSLDADATYNAFHITGSGNCFSQCRVTYNGVGAGVLFNRVLNGFVTTNSNTTEPNYFLNGFLAQGSYTGLDYLFSGTQTSQPIVDFACFDPTGRKALRVRGDLLLKDDEFVHRNTTGAADGKNWGQSLNSNQLILRLLNDAYSAATTWAFVDRTGMVVNYVRFPGSRVEVTGGDFRLQHATAQFVFTDAGGVPRQILAAYGGTGPGNGTPDLGDLLIGNASSAWTRLPAGGGFLFTASGSGVLGYEKVDLNTPGHVSGGALTSGKLTVWDGSKLISVADGMTATLNVVTLVTAVGYTLNYKDHAGANQTKNIIESVSSSTTVANFTNGRWMS